MRFTSTSPTTPTLLAALASASLLLAGCPGESLSGLGGPCPRPGRGTVAGCRSGFTCAHGVCRTTCESSRDCTAGRRCIAGEGTSNVCSVETEDTCRAETDCTGGLSCTRGECRTTCEDATECAGGTCSSGTCTEPVSMAMPDGSSCTTDETCMGESVCTYGRCRPSCSAGCDSDTRCINSGGVLGCSLPDEEDCAGESDCMGGLVCEASECRAPCMFDTDCGPGGRCQLEIGGTEGTCLDRSGGGRIDAAVASGTDAGRVAVPDAHIVGFDGGPRGAQSQLALAFTANPSLAQTVRVLSSFISPSMPMRDIVAASRLAPIGVSVVGRSDADGRGVAYVGTVDGTGAARLFRFPGDAPDAATDRSSDLSAATSLIDLALAEDGPVVRALAIRTLTADEPTTQAGWTWTEGTAPAAYNRTLGVGGHGVYTFGQAAISGGSRTVGPDQDLRYLVRERERISTGIDPIRYEAGRPFLTALDVGARVAASDLTTSIFESHVLYIRALPDFALIWDPESQGTVMMRLREDAAMLRTSYERLGFVDATDTPPVIAQQHLLRTEAMIAVPNGPSTTLHQISCPEPSECVSEAMTFLPTPGGTEASTLAAAPLRQGYALLTVDSEGIVLRALTRELEVVPGYDDGSPLDALGQSILELPDGTYNLTDLEAYAFAVEDAGGETRAVTLLVAGLYTNFTARTSRVWVGGIRVDIPM